VPCAHAGQQWLQRPLEFEKKRGDTGGGGRVVVTERRASEEREGGDANELGFQWIRGDEEGAGLYIQALQWADPTVRRDQKRGSAAHISKIRAKAVPAC
jgi:hypothetical protein